jgi:PQQ-like domain
MLAVKRFQAANFFRPPVFFAFVTFAAIKVSCADTNSVTIGMPVAATNAVIYAPAILPGNGLARHSFLYTGEWDHRKTNQTLFVVRDGRVAWTYDIPFNNEQGVMEELGDATMLSNGNIVFCRKTGASEVTPDKKIIWNLEAPKGTEIHSIQPVGLDRVLVTQNGNPAKLMLINIVTGNAEKELTLPVAHPTNSPHLQFRRVHQTKDGTYLAAHLADNKVVEYDADGKEIWSYAARGPWSASRLKNGNTLITSYHSTVLEVNKKGEVVWQFSEKDIPEYKCFIFQEADRLANGNTVICNWCPADIKDTKNWRGSVQLLEVTPEKKVVWALSSWDNPDLGPASSIQLLDEPGTPENPGDLQR